MSIGANLSENMLLYLKQHRVPDVFESLVTALAVYQPADVEGFMIAKMFELKEDPTKFEQLSWDSFIETKKIPLYGAFCTDFFWSLNYNFFQTDFLLTAKAWTFYNQTLMRKCYRSLYLYWKSAVHNKYVLKQELEEAHSYYISKTKRKHLCCWQSWINYKKKKLIEFDQLVKKCFDKALQRCVFNAWFKHSIEMKLKREFFERKILESNEEILKDPVSVLPEKISVNIFSFVTLRDLLNCAMVCQKWKEVTQSKVLWSRIDLANSEKDSISNTAMMNLIQKYHSILCQLNLRDCQSLSSDVMHSICSCRNLLDLNISCCLSVNDDVLKEISYGCISLLYLNVSHTKITDLSLRYIARYCTSIRYLDISHCKNITDKGLFYLANGKYTQKLVHLNMSGCVQLTSDGFHCLADGCTALNTIILNEFPRLTDECLEALVIKCRDLRFMSVLDSPLLTDASISLLVTAEKLAVLKLEGNNFVTDVSVNAVCINSELRHLYFVGVERITDASMKSLLRCKNLSVLNFADCSQISDFGVQFLVYGGLGSNLHEINLSNCVRITDLSLLKISLRCSSLTYANFSYCQNITDAGIEVLSAIQTLVSLDITACRITDVGAASLANNPNFKDIFLSECHSITDVGIEKLLPSERNLEIFDLSHLNFITDQCLKSLAYYCRRLRIFNISGCELISDEGIKYLCGVCRYLEQIDMSRCNLLTDRALNHIRKGCLYMKVVNILNCNGFTNYAVTKLRNKIKGKVLYTNDDVTSM
ncbi:F-box and leucine-rich repeat protein 13 isoform X1 [Hydra vulgaris]|uniref:F-box and leucine-rich repeat protein 13 isoform X1 n=1 Tax=Hydra vulgaris TaxID=6087 RepID=UPI0032EA64A0